MPSHQPVYQRRMNRGRELAYVTLTDSQTGRRKDIYLGAYGSPESREKYNRAISEWRSNGERLSGGQAIDATVVGLALKYRESVAQAQYKEQRAVQRAGDMLVDLYGSAAAEKFGPNELRLVREAMINAGWARRYVNTQVRRVVRMFKWGVSHGYVPADVYVALSTIEPLKQGRSRAPETEPVRPVDDKLVDAIEKFVAPQVWDVIQLQRLTGARGDELLKLRKGDIEAEEGATVWRAQLKEHKTAYRRHQRVIVFGPQCQKILNPYMMRRADGEYLFSPQEADKKLREDRAQARRESGTPLSCGNRPGTNVVPLARRKPGERYSSAAYGRAITRACDAAFPPPEELRSIRVPARGRKTKATRWETEAEWRERLGPEKWAQVEQWRKEHRWHPHQLRHAVATKLRRQFGLEAAQVWLGHSSALVTDAVYAERDQKRLDELASKIG